MVRRRLPVAKSLIKTITKSQKEIQSEGFMKYDQPVSVRLTEQIEKRQRMFNEP